MKKEQKLIDISTLGTQLFWDTDINKLDYQKAYIPIIVRVIERGDQSEIDEIVRLYSKEKVLLTICKEIKFLPNYAIERAIRFFPELRKEDMLCYQNRKDKSYHWI
ncbi:hypothetical protein HX045_09150 [Myroides odoratimimus]|uniref:DUF6922 domain-containing protein n=1 Tax=Myroides odoratimimus CCUG 10230 TaxID=883150 RepID=A0ABN0E6D3_9FLAO|nr:hypothetical protein [Myroides odoratimimus]EHO06162.2 hypothetical protein HMPREF9712_03225 [Myroides odoratimimus CCUG 10230]EHO09036.1 hypothetical protein HMPREF9714_02009 [Myroides odoratimimus CCUG 12901]MDM1483852.1 hypothetical protein [Myroides odoratimimus]MEC4054600.1 hypothetical protein [Myroides odoratimimus]